MREMGLTRSNFNAVAVTAEAGQRMVGAGNAANWPDITGGSVVDLTPAVFVGRLTGTRTGAAYGWERVFVSANSSGVIATEVGAYGDANNGTPTALPAIDPNGNETLVDGGATPTVLLWPCEQGGTWQYMIVGFGGGGGCDDETLCDGAWHTADYVTAVTLDCTAGTLTLDVTTDGSRDYWTRTTPP